MRERVPLGEVPRIDVDEAHRMMQRGEAVLLVDVRDRPEYDDRHIWDAVSMPAREFPRKYRELPHDSLVVIY